MNKLLEIKDKAVKFCGEYEHFILQVVRFAVAFIAFITIDLNIGYMAKISSMLVALLLALVCALLPVNAILWIASIMILLDMYALSIEVFAITFVLFLVLYFVYFRFAPKDGMLVILTPIFFHFTKQIFRPDNFKIFMVVFKTIIIKTTLQAYIFNLFFRLIT
jgi:hypothetical protein